MEIIFDPNKDASNILKHGISLSDAINIEWQTLYSFPDLRFDYQELRMIGYAYIGLRLHCVVYIDHHKTRRIISLRKANKREVIQYAKT